MTLFFTILLDFYLFCHIVSSSQIGVVCNLSELDHPFIHGSHLVADLMGSSIPRMCAKERSEPP